MEGKRERSTVLVKQAEEEKRGEGRKKERRGRGRFLQKREKVQGMHFYSLVLKKERKRGKKRGRKEPVRTSQGTCEEGEDRRKRGGESKKAKERIDSATVFQGVPLRRLVRRS